MTCLRQRNRMASLVWRKSDDCSRPKIGRLPAGPGTAACSRTRRSLCVKLLSIEAPAQYTVTRVFGSRRSLPRSLNTTSSPASPHTLGSPESSPNWPQVILPMPSANSRLRLLCPENTGDASSNDGVSTSETASFSQWSLCMGKLPNPWLRAYCRWCSVRSISPSTANSRGPPQAE